MLKTRSLALALVLSLAAAGVAQAVVSYGMSLYGEFKYGPDFTHFDYANPDAPKGGTVKLATIGTYDNFNPFILRGQSAIGMGELFDTLMAPRADELSTVYGLVAESVELAPDHRSVTFTLRPQARFNDGS